MSWKIMPPEWLAVLIEALRNSEFLAGVKAFLAVLAAAGVGVMAKVADEVKSGERRKFFSKQLWLDAPALLMTATITIGVAAYYDLPGPVAAGVSVFLGYAGPRAIGIWISRNIRR